MSKTLFGILLLVSCLHLLSATSEYRVVNGSTNATTITFRLAYQGKDEYIGKPTSPICKNLVFTFRMLAYNDFTFKIVD